MAWLYANTPVTKVQGKLRMNGPAGPTAAVTLAPSFELTTHDPGEFDAIAAELTLRAAELREALAAESAPVAAGVSS